MHNQTESFAKILKSGLEARMAKNSSFSLRAFARQIGISPATLSGVLSGKRNLSPAKIGQVGFALGLSPDEIWQYQRKAISPMIQNQKREFQELSQDLFSIISEWYHLTILEVMKLRDFQPTPRWIAKRLGINVNQARLAIERLQKVGILEVTKEGQWIDRANGFTTHYQKEKTTDAKKRYQKQLLEKSLESLKVDDFSVRDHSSIAMAINSQDIMKAKQEIQNFRKRLSSILESTKNPDQVYQLQISFFSLTKKE